MSKSELSLNFGISHGRFHDCTLNNFLQEEKGELVGLWVEEDDELRKETCK
jgi:hypothetical protein